MLTSIVPESQDSASRHTSQIVVVNMGKRQPVPQDITLASLSNDGANSSPTITMTMTLYSAGMVTSTASDAATSTSGKEEDGTLRTTGTSTVYNTVTVTSTKMSTTTVHDTLSATALIPLTSSNLTSSAAPPPLVPINTYAATASANSTDHELPANHQGGRIAGATLGSMAAFGVIGFLIWYCCARKNGKRKMKFKLNIKRRKSSTAKTPQLEDQTMEETRRVMLEKSKNLNGFMRSAPAQSNHSSAAELPGDVGVKRSASQTESSRTHPSWIGVAMSSSTPPNTPPLPRSNSQKGTMNLQNTSTSPIEPYPTSLMPGFGSQQMPASLMPTPLRPAMKPAPIITTQSLARPEHVSPLSPRGMLNAVSNTTTRAWRRASQALSPGAYQRISDDGQSGFGAPKRRDSKPRNPELEIGHQTDKNWEGRWI